MNRDFFKDLNTLLDWHASKDLLLTEPSKQNKKKL